MSRSSFLMRISSTFAVKLPNKVWMVNFRVHDIDKMVAQLQAAGIEVKDPETYPKIGRFARLHDPEGNPIELWQPA